MLKSRANQASAHLPPRMPFRRSKLTRGLSRRGLCDLVTRIGNQLAGEDRYSKQQDQRAIESEHGPRPALVRCLVLGRHDVGKLAGAGGVFTKSVHLGLPGIWPFVQKTQQSRRSVPKRVQPCDVSV